MQKITEILYSDGFSKRTKLDGSDERMSQWSGSRSNAWVRPDAIVRNAKVNGYRKPSNWSGRNTMALFRGQIDSEGTYSMYRYTHKGDLAMWAPKIPNILSESAEHADVQFLRMKILNNIRQEVFDAAMVLAELQGTVGTLATNLDRLGRTMLAIKNRKPPHYDYLMHGRRPRNLSGKELDKFNREVAGTYLEWKYGAMPIVYDIQGACKALDMNEKGSLFDNPPLLVARAVVKGTEVRSIPVEGTVTTTWGGTIIAKCDASIKVAKELKARCDYRVDSEGLRGLNRYGLGLGSVATVLLERTPFSFVLNMAFPIAELIKAWTALAGVSLVGYCETQVVKVTPISGGSISGTSWIPWSGTVEPTSKELLSFTRIAYPTVPFPLPFVRNPIKTGNLATALALFTQLRKKK